jgi:pimeloyl-ACP methyl ester carboxylesterase
MVLRHCIIASPAALYPKLVIKRMNDNMSTITLTDGRILAFAEYGDPHGRPVFFFHGIPGSRLFRPPDEVTTRLGVRLITTDRPGSGLSTFQHGRRILDWPGDLLQLADRLGTRKFHVAGHSGGGPYALACAYANPERVIGAAVLSGAGPVNSPESTRNMTAINKFGVSIGRFTPWPVWRLLVWFLYRKGYKDPASLFNRAAGDRPAADTAVLNEPGVLELNYASQSEGLRQGTRGFALEARLLVTPWGFRLEQINPPVQLWHGTEDVDAPVAMAKAVAARLPNSHLTICQGEGHMLLFPHWEEILSQLPSE